MLTLHAHEGEDPRHRGHCISHGCATYVCPASKALFWASTVPERILATRTAQTAGHRPGPLEDPTPVQRDELWGLPGPTKGTLGTKGLAPHCRLEQRPVGQRVSPQPTEQVLAQDVPWGSPTICPLATSQVG